jgi:antitoxin (DNA-binding transcriptional repressor) of toxin-antitoxin stability system
MPMKVMTAEEFVRNVRRVLDRFELDQDEVLITRDETPIARLVPDAQGMTATQAFGDLYGILPEGEGDAWLRDAEGLDRALDQELRDPWEE